MPYSLLLKIQLKRKRKLKKYKKTQKSVEYHSADNHLWPSQKFKKYSK